MKTLIFVVCSRWRDVVYEMTSGDVDLTDQLCVNDAALESAVSRFSKMGNLRLPSCVALTTDGLAQLGLVSTLTVLDLGGARALFDVGMNGGSDVSDGCRGGLPHGRGSAASAE